MPNAHSRSISVVSAAHDEDISSLMIRGATDLRSAKFEIEEQVYIYNIHLNYSHCNLAQRDRSAAKSVGKFQARNF